LHLAGCSKQVDEFARRSVLGSVTGPQQAPVERLGLVRARVHLAWEDPLEQLPLAGASTENVVDVDLIEVAQRGVLQQALDDQPKQGRGVPADGELARDVARLAETARGDRLPDVGSEEDLQGDAVERDQVAVDPEQGAEGVGLKLAGLREGDVEAVQEEPDVDVVTLQSLIGELEPGRRRRPCPGPVPRRSAAGR
jgi:hypothetical protein